MMKKLYSLVAFIALTTTINTHTMDPERHPMFKLLDTFIPEHDTTTNWRAVFGILQKLVLDKNLFTVNEYLSQHGLTLLCQAVEDDDFLAAKILLEEYHANPNKSTVLTGMTPLMIACSQGNIEMIVLLLEHDADPSIKNSQGHDSFYFAQMNARYNSIHNDTGLRILKTYKQQ
jgi:hypothetical protein